MRILVFRHVPFEHLGLIQPALAGAGIAAEYIDLHPQWRAQADSASADGLIVMGGPMSANDNLPWLRAEIDVIRQAIADGCPVLGVCLGAQLIARSLGAPVYPNRSKEVGWFPVHWTEAGRADRLLRGLRQPETIFHWHGETFDLPDGAEWLAWTERCRNQAFRFGDRVYGFQFHLETTPEMIAGWCREDANRRDVIELEEPIAPDANAARLSEVAGIVFGRWVAMVQEMARRRPTA